MHDKIRRRVLPAAVLFVSAIVLGALALSMLPQGLHEAPGEDDDTVLVNDGANLVPIVPAEGAAVSTLAPSDFSLQDGVVSYTGSAYRTLQGIDVSEYQGEIDWQQVRAGGVDFAYLRLGYRGSTEGLLNEDAMYRRNLRGAQSQGVETGVYFFSQAVTVQEAQEEADYVLSLLDGWIPSLPVMFDWECVEIADSRSVSADTSQLTDCALAFCERMQAAGCTAGVYLNRQQGYYVYDMARLQAVTLWVADPNDWSDFYYAFSLWQYTFSGTVAGIDTAVDRDLLFIPRESA